MMFIIMRNMHIAGQPLRAITDLVFLLFLSAMYYLTSSSHVEEAVDPDHALALLQGLSLRRA
jgi:hypothetical protein